MKRFRDLFEAWHDTMPSPFKASAGKTVDIFKNPSRAELHHIIKNSEAGTARGIFHGDDVYAFDAMHAIHDNVKDHLGLKVTRREFFKVGKDHWSSEYVDNDETLHRNLNHPWIKRTIPNHRFFHS